MTDTFALTARLRMLWVASFIVPGVVQLSLSLQWSNGGLRRSEDLLFVIVLSAASLCALASGMVINRAKRTNEVELGYLGVFFLAVSVLSLVHGLTTPGVLFGPNTTTSAAVFWGIPIALLAGLPAVLTRSKLATAIDKDWRRWVFVSQILIVALGAVLLIFPNLLPAPTTGETLTTVVAGLSFAGCVFLSKRHLDLAIIAKSTGPLAISLGYGLVGSSALVWVGSSPYSIGFWVAHMLDFFGVFLGSIGALMMYRRTDHVRSLVEPVLLVDPRSALEIGLEPSVHEFIADLELKDPITRDHVLRTTELAMIVGQKMGLNATMLRELGLSAMLHDIGKLLIPDALLNKPGPLTPNEYEIVKRHAQYGADIVEKSGLLASIAPIIRAHHEHIDGSGYPIGLMGTQIPMNARIVSVCDAFDALSNTRQYRKGVSLESAIEVLERHAGSQWDRRVVETVVRTVRSDPPRAMPERLDQIGRIGCDCIPRVA
jgi:putative nucleotidyltransferase with HDIG domain